VKFLCDEMLQRLGNWLRAAGYDTLIETDGRQDYELLQEAIATRRKLITRDRKLLEHRRAPGHVIYLEGNNLDECAASLSAKLPIDWQLAPFTRCLICNTKLRKAKATEQKDQPEDVRKREGTLYCPTCNKVYWDGSHVRRMRHRLQQWQQAYGTPHTESQ
jgi:hypothetical protein